MSWSGEWWTTLHDAYPGKWSQLSFPNSRNGTRAPFHLDADVDALVQPKEAAPRRGHKSHIYEQHRPCIVGYKIKSYFSDLDESYRVIHGPDWVKKFIRRLVTF